MNRRIHSVYPPGPASNRLPGLYVDAGVRAPSKPVAANVSVPVFIGFGALRDRSAADRRSNGSGVVSRRFADFDRDVAPAPQSHLRHAVRGFFANGGQSCVVQLVGAAEDERAAARQFSKVLDIGGPLEDREDIDLVCIPDLWAVRWSADGAAVENLQAMQLRHCERAGDRFAILDAPDAPDLIRVGDSLRSEFGAMYFPWIDTDARAPGDADEPETAALWRLRPVHNSAPRTSRRTPPCGHVAGVYARVDRTAGAWRAPANLEVFDAFDLTQVASSAQQIRLLNARVNCLVRVAAHGIHLSSARTLNSHDRSIHVSTARLVIRFRRWLASGMADLVFEPDSPQLEERIRLRLLDHCMWLWESGALAGDSPGAAFEVKCDRENNGVAVRDRGEIVADIRLAPSIPAEFIMVRVMRDANGFAITGP